MVRKFVLALFAVAAAITPVAAHADGGNPVDFFCATGTAFWSFNAGGTVLGFDYTADPEKCAINHNFQVHHVTVMPATQWLVWSGHGYRRTDPGTLTQTQYARVEAAGYLATQGDRESVWVATVVALVQPRAFPQGEVIGVSASLSAAAIHVDGLLVPDNASFGTPISEGPGHITFDISCGGPGVPAGGVWNYQDAFASLHGAASPYLPPGGPETVAMSGGLLAGGPGTGDWIDLWIAQGWMDMNFKTSFCAATLPVPFPPGAVIGQISLSSSGAREPAVEWIHFPAVPVTTA